MKSAFPWLLLAFMLVMSVVFWAGFVSLQLPGWIGAALWWAACGIAYAWRKRHPQPHD